MRENGFTLVELLVTIVVAAILLAIAIPSFLDQVDRRRLAGAADNLLTSMRYAQAEAMKRNVQIEVEFLNTGGTGWSYVVKTNPNMTVSGNDYRGTELDIHSDVADAETGPPAKPANAIVFDPKRNTVLYAPASGSDEDDWQWVTITSARGHDAVLLVTPESTMRLCTTTGVVGYPACP